MQIAFLVSLPVQTTRSEKEHTGHRDVAVYGLRVCARANRARQFVSIEDSDSSQFADLHETQDRGDEWSSRLFRNIRRYANERSPSGRRTALPNS